MFSEIRIKELREDKLTELHLINRGVGISGALVLAELIKFTSVLSRLSLEHNDFNDESKELLQGAAKATGRDIVLEL